MSNEPFVTSVLHPSDFGPGGEKAFAHALAIVLYYQAGMTVLHVVPKDRAVDVWTDSVPVRATLERWGLLEAGSERSEVWQKLRLWVEKLNVRSSDPRRAILEQLEQRPVDMIVLANEGQAGLPRWFQRGGGGELARRSETMTLFVPDAGDGFVDPRDGQVRLKRILVPVDHQPSPVSAVVRAARAAVMSTEDQVEIVLLRVGSDDWPPLDPPSLQSVSWRREQRDGDPVKAILGTADELSADLIVLATQGARGFLGALRGSVTDQVVRTATRPVLAVPSIDG